MEQVREAQSKWKILESELYQEEKADLLTHLMTRLFVEQPLVLAGSAYEEFILESEIFKLQKEIFVLKDNKQFKLKKKLNHKK